MTDSARQPSMTNSEIIKTILYPAVEELADAGNAKIEKNPETSLFGPHAALDSLGLVNFIVIVEEQIEKQTGKIVRLVNEKAMSRKNSPWRTLSTLADYITELLQDGRHE